MSEADSSGYTASTTVQRLLADEVFLAQIQPKVTGRAAEIVHSIGAHLIEPNNKVDASHITIRPASTQEMIGNGDAPTPAAFNSKLLQLLNEA